MPRTLIEIVSAASMFLFCTQSDAAVVSFGPVTVDTVSIIALPVFYHQPGNLEIAVPSFGPATGLNCAPTYITTLKSNDVDGKLFALLTAAKAANRAVTLVITDDPAYTAFPGRCSLAAVVF